MNENSLTERLEQQQTVNLNRAWATLVAGERDAEKRWRMWRATLTALINELPPASPLLQ